MLGKVGMARIRLGVTSLIFFPPFIIFLTHYYKITFFPCLDFSN
jgi:hypothetical protein